MGLLKRILGQRGYEKFTRKLAQTANTYVKVHRLSAWASEDLRTVTILNNYELNKVLDVGANVGQFADSLFDYGYDGEVVSFEPTSQAYATVSAKAQKNKNWHVADKCAIGDSDGEIEINISDNTAFNSIKEIKEQYASYNSQSAISNKENVAIFRLDSLRGKYFNERDNLFLKIDTQGFEKEVLQGAEESLKIVKGVKIEVPLVSVYEGVEWHMVDFINFFDEKGFKCISTAEVSVDRRTGVVYEVDMIFLKENLLSESA